MFATWTRFNRTRNTDSTEPEKHEGGYRMFETTQIGPLPVLRFRRRVDGKVIEVYFGYPKRPVT